MNTSEPDLIATGAVLVGVVIGLPLACLLAERLWRRVKPFVQPWFGRSVRPRLRYVLFAVGALGILAFLIHGSRRDEGTPPDQAKAHMTPDENAALLSLVKANLFSSIDYLNAISERQLRCLMAKVFQQSDNPTLSKDPSTEPQPDEQATKMLADMRTQDQAMCNVLTNLIQESTRSILARTTQPGSLSSDTAYSFSISSQTLPLMKSWWPKRLAQFSRPGGVSTMNGQCIMARAFLPVAARSSSNRT